MRRNPSNERISSSRGLETVFIVAIALALTTGLLLGASVLSDAVFQWLQSLAPGKARMVQSILVLLTVLLLGIGVYIHRKSRARDGL